MKDKLIIWWFVATIFVSISFISMRPLIFLPKINDHNGCEIKENRIEWKDVLLNNSTTIYKMGNSCVQQVLKVGGESASISWIMADCLAKETSGEVR